MKCKDMHHTDIFLKNDSYIATCSLQTYIHESHRRWIIDLHIYLLARKSVNNLRLFLYSRHGNTNSADSTTGQIIFKHKINSKFTPNDH